MSLLLAACLSAALATDAFDPETPDARYTDAETFTEDGSIKLWSAIERHIDGEDGLFHQEAFNDATAWVDGEFTPHIASLFGTATPDSGTFLLHMGLNEEVAVGTPVLLVHGVGDNASRGFITLATKLDRNFKPVYALTFPHPHGDLFLQAEVVADAIARIKARTGADKVDVVAHSKGGMAAALYASHTDGAPWGDAAYAQHGTPYRGDIRRLVLMATPLDGVDTGFRWPAMNLLGLEADSALAPVSWTRYYPYTTANLLVYDELGDQDFAPDGADLFPGQRQLLKRQNAPLPGSQTWMGGYALQPDWLTTYEGGRGFTSESEGIDAAIAEGGNFVNKLAAQGVDPEIEVFLLGGSHGIMPNASDELGSMFASAADESDWRTLVGRAQDRGILGDVSDLEFEAMADGNLVLGEISAQSDGLVFLASALSEASVNARGAVVVDAKAVALSHLDLLYASPVTAQLMRDLADEDPDVAWMASLADRYEEADTLGWVENALHDEGLTLPGTTDTGTTPGGGGNLDDYDASDAPRPCGGCSQSQAAGPWWWVLAPLLWRRRLSRPAAP